MESLRNWSYEIEKRWHKISGLLIGVAVVTIFFFLGAEFSPENIEGNYYFWIPLILADTALIIFWLWSKRIRTCKTGKLGIIVAIKAPPNMYEELKFNFINRMYESVNVNIFHFQVLPQYIAEEITDKTKARLYLEKSKSHMILFGHCQEGTRKVKDQTSNRFEIKMNSLVKHANVEEEISDKLSSELGELIPTASFDKDNQLENYQITTQWLVTFAKYFTGISRMISQDLNGAINVFQDLKEELDNVESRVKQVAVIRKRTNHYLQNMYIIKGMNYYNDVFRSTWKIEDLEIAFEFIKRANDIIPNHPDYLPYAAIHAFWKDRNLTLARKWLSQIKNPEYIVIKQYSLAFLAAYEGNLNEALSLYKRAFKKDQHEGLPIEIEQFIASVLELEPDKYHLYLCLALINEHKGDYESAFMDLNRFISLVEDREKYKQIAEDLTLRINTQQIASTKNETYK